MSDGPAIRPLAPADAASAAALHAACPEPWPRADWARFLADPVVFGLGAFEGGALTGAVLARAVADEAEVLTILVAEDRRRRGAGRGLLAAALAEAARRGAATAFLEVAADNSAAIALYRAAGFVEIGRRRGYYRRGSGTVDALAMRRALDDAAHAT